MSGRGWYWSLLLCCLALFPAPQLWADSKEKIDQGAQEALARLREHAPESEALLEQAAGILVFPDVVKLGFGVGGEYGEGSLLVKDRPNSYFVTAGASIGLQAGAQVKSEVILFMTPEALQKFQNSRGWKAGVDGSVALFKLGADGSFDTQTIKESVIGFIFSNKGLMYNLTMEGRKITRIAR
jgi:lipid-binding SYLF domain-containing protein